ncbi:phage tail protein I [uncultured Dysosmobacter sp.]|uniref:phage tail protein I n=1 Tax=uncultured Dysosmobacter sp. TaxID=2591384 RepID=UPI00260CCF02|nr:phage tail protein I [uncultured Dysosmobacter sp.]
MNDSDLYSADYLRSLPPSLKADPDIIALAKAVAEQLHVTAAEIEKNIIYPRIDELDEKTLDILAYDLHVDWYDVSYSIEAKRATIKSSMRVHRRLGTKYAVEKALGAVFPGTRVEEWFEYGGKPYTFRVIIGAGTGVTAEQQAAVLERVRFYKNLRSHLEAIRYQLEAPKGTVTVGGCYSMEQRLEIWPYLARDIEPTAAVIAAAGFVVYKRTLEIYPDDMNRRL